MMKYERYSGTKIGLVLRAQGRRQDWLAHQLGVSAAALNRWIKGHRQIDVETARRIADILGVPLFLLVDVPIGTDKEPTDSKESAA